MVERDLQVRFIDDLRSQVPAIIKDVNADHKLALRAAVNPLFALEGM